MKKELKVLIGRAGRSLADGDFFKNIINEHFKFIEKQCYKAVRLRRGGLLSVENPVNIENEVLELSNQVLDTLQRDNYLALREFKGKSRITTYITAIISRQAVDLIRKKLGRSREKERAKQLGDIGLLVFQRVIKNGYPLPDVLEELKIKGEFSGSLEELETFVQHVKGKPINPGVFFLNRSDSTCNSSDPQEILMENQRKKKIDELIQDILAQLSGEERLLLRMRFPVSVDEKPKTVAQVSKILGITQKAVYKRIARLLKKCKDKLDREGVTINDLL